MFSITQIINKFVPVQLYSTALTASKITYTGVSITDTAVHWVTTNQNWSTYKSVVLNVTNSHNQPVTLTLNQQNIADFEMYISGSTATQKPINIVIPAGATSLLVTPDDWTILGYPFLADSVAMKATCTTAPTSGTLTVVAYAMPLGA